MKTYWYPDDDTFAICAILMVVIMLLLPIAGMVILPGTYETPREARDRYVEMHRDLDEMTSPIDKASDRLARYKPRYEETTKDRRYHKALQAGLAQAKAINDAMTSAVAAGDEWWRKFNAIPTAGADIQLVIADRTETFHKAEALRKKDSRMKSDFDTEWERWLAHI